MKWIVIVKMVLLVILLNDLLPYKRMLVRWSWGKFKISSLIAMAKLLRRVWRVIEYIGQRSRNFRSVLLIHFLWSICKDG